MAQICAAQVHTIADVEAHVQKNFTAPIDTWALTDAQLTMDKHKDKKKGVFMFPVEKIYQQLQKVVRAHQVYPIYESIMVVGCL